MSKGRQPEYMSDETFAVIWNTNKTVDDVESAIADMCRAAGRQPMSRAYILVKAGNLRMKGLELEKKKPSRQGDPDVARINALLAKVRENLAKGIMPDIPPLEPVARRQPPPVDPAPQIRKIIKGKKS